MGVFISDLLRNQNFRFIYSKAGNPLQGVRVFVFPGCCFLMQAGKSLQVKCNHSYDGLCSVWNNNNISLTLRAPSLSFHLAIYTSVVNHNQSPGCMFFFYL